MSRIVNVPVPGVPEYPCLYANVTVSKRDNTPVTDLELSDAVKSALKISDNKSASYKRRARRRALQFENNLIVITVELKSPALSSYDWLIQHQNDIYEEDCDEGD